MKYPIFFILFLSTNLWAQRIDIVLIGVSHNYSSYRQQDFSGIYTKIKTFGPDAFFGEFLSKEDERLVMDYWCKQDNIRRIEILRKNRDIAVDILPKTLDSLKQLSEQTPNNYQIKVDLAHAFYLNQDIANAHYQFWQVFSHLKKTPDPVLENYVNALLNPELDTMGRSMKRLKTSEYALIAFPLMQEMNLQELLAMDCQDFDLNWAASSSAFHQKFKTYTEDTNALYISALNVQLTKRDKGFEKNADIEKNSKNVTEWLNTDEASAIFASGDFYFPGMYDITGFPKDEMFSQIHWWLMRNKGMCNNVVNRARARGLKKVVVLAGANHRKYMQDIFKTMPNVTVRNINEIE